MTALLIILAVLLVLAFLLLMPVTLRAGYRKELWADARYLFFKYTITPRKEKEPKKKAKKKIKKEEKKEPEEEETTTIRDIIKETGISGFLTIVKELAKAAGSVLKSLLSHTTISRLTVQIAVCGGDAAEAAVNYGYVCTAVYPAVGIVTSAVKKYKKLEIDIRPDYDGRESRIGCELVARAPMLFVLGNAVKGAYKLLKEFIKAKQKGILK